MGIAVRATETVTFFRRKPGIYCCRGGFFAVAFALPISGSIRTCSGKIRPRTFENIPQFWRNSFPVPRIDGHKYAPRPCCGGLRRPRRDRRGADGGGAARYGLARDWYGGPRQGMHLRSTPPR